MDLHSGVSYWPVRSGLLQAYPALDRDESADVAIIGAGVTGALAAHCLTTAGADVVVVDRRDVASGSTAASTGLLQYETDTSLSELIELRGAAVAVRAWKLALEAIGGIEQLCGELGDPSGFARRPSLYLASSVRDARALAAEYEVRAGAGFDVTWLDAAALEARYGIAAPGAISSRGDGEIDSYRFTHALLAAVVARGGRVYDRTEVSAVEADDDGVRLVTNRAALIRARRLVWAAGYESVEETQRRVGRLYSTWAIATEPVTGFGRWTDRTLIWETARPYLYLRTTDDGRIIVGGEDERYSRRHDSERRLAKKSRKLVEAFGRLFPGIDIEVAFRWGGAFSVTRDGLPYIGSVPEHPHAWLALGYGGNGITFSMIAADLIRDAWLGRPNPDAELFRFERG